MTDTIHNNLCPHSSSINNNANILCRQLAMTQNVKFPKLWSADQNRNELTDSEECEQKIVDGFPHEKIMMINGTHERKYFGL